MHRFVSVPGPGPLAPAKPARWRIPQMEDEATKKSTWADVGGKLSGRMFLGTYILDRTSGPDQHIILTNKPQAEKI